MGGEGRVVWWENGRCVGVLYMYRISSYKSLPQINASLVYTPGGSSILSLINAGLRLNAGSS